MDSGPLDSTRSRLMVGALAVVVVIGFVVWVVVRGEEVPDVREPPTPPGATITSDDEPPFDDPIDEPSLDDETSDPPPDEGFLTVDEQQRWPSVSDAAIAAAEQAFELDVPAGGRLLVLVACESQAFGTSIVVNGVGLPSNEDIVGLLSPEADRQPGFMTDPAGNGFHVTVLSLPEPSYTLTFPTLDNLSLSFLGCPDITDG